MRRLAVLGSLAAVVAITFVALPSASASRGDGAPAALAPPPRNPFLATSNVPIGHVDSAQTTSSRIDGPRGKSQDVDENDLRYTHLGPGHFGIAISPKCPDGKRVIWSN